MESVIRPFLQFAGKMCLGLAAWLSASTLTAQAPMHFEHEGKLPPGAIGSQRLARGGPVHGYFQPVEITAPSGAAISPAMNGVFEDSDSPRLLAGMLIGAVYRLRVTNIPLQAGMEVYPTIEVIDRTYPPRRSAKRFPIQIELTQDELELALQGSFVTRVIYLEEPSTALPFAEEPGRQPVFEAPRGEDPLAVADRLGRPVAILRMGGRVPDLDAMDAAFLFGCPPLTRLHVPTVAEYYQQYGVPVETAPEIELPGRVEPLDEAAPPVNAATPDADSAAVRRKTANGLSLSGSTPRAGRRPSHDRLGGVPPTDGITRSRTLRGQDTP